MRSLYHVIQLILFLIIYAHDLFRKYFASPQPPPAPARHSAGSGTRDLPELLPTSPRPFGLPGLSALLRLLLEPPTPPPRAAGPGDRGRARAPPLARPPALGGARARSALARPAAGHGERHEQHRPAVVPGRVRRFFFILSFADVFY